MNFFTIIKDIICSRSNLISVICLIGFFSFSQTSYYVAKSGSNSNSGTSLSSPFLTISHAISQINAGDQIFIRRGTYHEEIIINNIDSSIGNETLITNYNNEQVIIDGSINVTGQWIDDTIGGVGVKKVESYTESITQLFVGNDQMVMARWPNAQFSDLSIYDHDNWAHGEETGSTDGSFLIDETYENPGSLNLANSIGILNVGSFRTFNRNIATHTQQGGDDVITYTNPIGDNGIGAGLSNNGELKDKHHYFFFEGKKEFLDIQNEWFLDHVNDVLYLKPPNGIDLNNTAIRGKIRDYSISISGSEHLKINGLTFFATTIHTSGSKNIEISECNFYFPSHSRRMLGDLSGANVTTFGTGSGNTARVDSSIVSGCLFINTEGEALVIKGNNNTIKNSYFRNIDWSATELNGLMVSVFVDGTSNTFTGNEIYHTGASATVWPGEQSIFSYNIVSSTGHAQSDGSVFQGTKNYVFGSEVHHNFVYDTEKYAFRYDAPGGDAAQAGSFGVMHHNIADNTLGLMIKGNNQIIAHNTVINTINNRNDIIILAEDCSNTNTWMYNNLAERIGSHRSDVLFSAPSNGPMPIGTEGYIKNGNNWEVCDSNDGALYSGTGTGSSTANMDAINQSRPGISYNANVESLINYNPGNGKTISDYQPTSNQIIDQGVSLTNTVSTSLTASNQLNSIVPHTPVGSGTDIGAIDGNSLWTPGVQGWTPQQNINLEDIFYDPGIVSSNLLLHLDFANSTSYSGSGNDVYDLSDNYNHGVLNGNPNILNNTGGEIDLDGTNDYIQLNDPFSHQDHTIEIWLKMKETSSGWIWDARDADNDGYILFNRQGVGNSFNYFINTNDLDSYSQQHTNEWVQVIATHNSNKSKIFVNGQKVAEKNVNKNINTTRNVRIGTRSWGNPDHHLKAEIGIVRYYNKAFFSDDVLQNYNANAARFGLTSNPASPTSIDITQPIPTRGLKLYLDSTKSDSYQSGSNTWHDLSGNDYDFTVSGNPSFNSSIKGGVIDFQAGGDYATNNSDPILDVNSYTKFAVFKPTTNTTNNIISGGVDSKHAFFMAGSTNKFQAGHNNDWDKVIDQPNGGASILNIWNLGTVTFDTDSGFDLYYGGNLVDSNSSDKVPAQQTSPLVNIARYHTGSYFTGYIPVAIIYDRKLSQNEINSLSNHFAPRYSLSPTNTSSLTIDEGVAMGTVLANLSSTDSDSTEFTYSLVSGNGTNDQHNSSFTISGTQVVTNNIISFDNTPVMNINLKVEDESNNSFTSSFVVYVNDLNRTPTDIGVSSLTFPESVSASSTIANLSAVDSDTSDTHVFSLINGNGSNDADNSSFTVSGTSLIINSIADFETKASYNIYLNVFDGANNFAKAFTVSVTNVNEAPSDIFLLEVDTNNLVLYLNAKNTDSYPGSGSQWFDLSGNYNNGLINGATYNSSADGGFSFDGNDDKVLIQHDNSLNFESNLTVIYTLKPNWLNSNYSPGISKGQDENTNFSTWIGKDRQIDISTQLGNNQTENVNSLRPAYDATNDISTGNWYTIAITIDSSNNQKTYINGSQVGVTKSITLGATNTLNLTIGQLPGFGHSTYGDGELGKIILYNAALTSAQVSSNFNLMSNSSTPTSSYASIFEGSPVNTLVGSFTATDSDTSNLTFSIIQGDGNNDQHNSYFTISGNQLKVNNGNINYDITTKLFVNIQVSDGDLTYTKPFEIAVIDLNRAPTDIGISSTTFLETVSASSTIASLSAVDSDTSDTHVFSLINGNGSNDADNSSFTISGTSLIINSTADYESKAAYNIYLNVFDGANNYAKAFTVSVTNVNESPSNLGFLSSDLAIPTNGLILHLDSSNSDSYPGNGNTWFDLSGQNAHAEATTLPAFGLNGAQIKNFDFSTNSHGFNSVDISQEYRDLIVIKKLETGGGIKTVFGHYNFQDDSFRINGSQVKVQNTFDANDWQFGSTSDVFVNGSFITQNTTVLNQWVFVRTYRSNNAGFGNSFRYEISKGHGGGGRSYRGKINLILAYNRKLTNQEVQDIYQSLSPRLNGTETSLTVSSTSFQTSIDEEVSIGTEVGTLTATDSDTTNLTYSLVSGNGTNDQHNSLFTVSGTQLIVAGNIDYETNATLNIYVQVSDGENTYQKAMIVNVNDVKETPLIQVSDIIKTFGGANFDLTATSSSTGAFTYTVADQSVASINGNTVTILRAGSTSITVTQAEDNNFTSATATFSLTINKADVIIMIDDITKNYGDNDFNLTAVSSSTFVLTSDFITLSPPTNTNPTYWYVSSVWNNNSFYENAPPGYADNKYYTPWLDSPQSWTAKFNNTSQWITLDLQAESMVYQVITKARTISNQNYNQYVKKANILYGSDNTNWTTIYNNTSLQTASDDIPVSKVLPTPVPARYVKVEPTEWNTNISMRMGVVYRTIGKSLSSNGSLTFSSSNNNVVSTSSSSATIKGAGSVNITVSQAETSNYNSSTSSFTITVNKIDPTITFDNLTKTFGDLDFNLTATSSSTGAFTFNILDTNIATVTGSSTTIVGAGTTTVTVNQVADSNYSAAIATMTLRVDKADPGIGNFSQIIKTFGDQSFEIIEPTKNSNNTSDFIYSSSNPLIASVTGKIITIHKAGSVSITANLPADNNFIASSVSTSLTINKANQSISIGELPTTLPLKDFNSISLTASSTSGSPVSMSLANGSAASLNGAPGNYSLVSIQQTGLVTITFFVSENSSENYKAATVTLVVDVVKVNQNISLNTAPPNFLSFSENLSFTIDASSSSSLPLSYNILSGNGLINSNIVSVTGIGQIIIQLSQQGNNEFNPAPLSNLTVNVGQGNTLLSEFNISEKFVNDSPFDITPPNSNRSGEISYTSSNPQIATISGTKITILNIGQTTITANQIATNNYKSGTISSVFIVNQIINPDFDNDGIDDPYDNCFSVPNPDQNDNDSDGIGDSCDNDDDNDGVDDLLDNCRSESNSSQDDFDNDGIGNKCDIDDDNDGYNDIDDLFPLDESEWADFDQDGVGNNEDKDDDNDNWSDEIEILCNTNPFDTQNYPGDYDSDLTPDCIDEDLDNDGYNNDMDIFPYDSNEWSDNDNDSIGDNADLDDDNDNWTDLEEIECLSDPLDSDSIPEDFDQDGDPNCFDIDDDNDGYNDTVDAFPFDSSEWIDTDLDGVGDNSDNDFNGDGLVDDKLFPTEFISPNGDGINDSWVIVNAEFFPNCEVWIYTRMGQLIYNSKRYNNDWSGLYNGQPLPESSYVYLIDNNGDGKIDQKGWIYIAR